MGRCVEGRSFGDSRIQKQKKNRLRSSPHSDLISFQELSAFTGTVHSHSAKAYSPSLYQMHVENMPAINPNGHRKAQICSGDIFLEQFKRTTQEKSIFSVLKVTSTLASV